LFPSLYEGFGFPPLEAMACGIPVIVSDNSSLPEVVGEAGVFIKNPLDPDEIANSIHKVLDDKKLQAKLKIKGLKQVQKFRWDETAAQTLKLYRAAYDE
jgi:glycosyltransferase involved in cell wall biosynthesis